MKVGNDSAALSPLLLCFEVDYAIWHGTVGAEAPFVFLAELDWKCLLEQVHDGVGGLVKKWFKKFRGLPCGKASFEVDLGAKYPKVLEFVVSLVEDDFVTKKLLELLDRASCESGFMAEML